MAQVNMPKSSIGQQPAAEPQKKFQKVVKGKVTLKEQNDIQKIANEFLAEDLKTVKNRIVVDYLLPMLKNGLWSIFNSAVSIALFGEDRSRGFEQLLRLPHPAEQLRHLLSGRFRQPAGESEPGRRTQLAEPGL